MLQDITLLANNLQMFVPIFYGTSAATSKWHEPTGATGSIGIDAAENEPSDVGQHLYLSQRFSPPRRPVRLSVSTGCTVLSREKKATIILLNGETLNHPFSAAIIVKISKIILYRGKLDEICPFVHFKL